MKTLASHRLSQQMEWPLAEPPPLTPNPENTSTLLPSSPTSHTLSLPLLTHSSFSLSALSVSLFCSSLYISSTYSNGPWQLSDVLLMGTRTCTYNRVVWRRKNLSKTKAQDAINTSYPMSKKTGTTTDIFIIFPCFTSIGFQQGHTVLSVHILKL